MRGARWMMAGAVTLAVSSWAPTAWAKDDDPVELVLAQTEIPEDGLLDIGIHVFDPGLPENEEDLAKMEENGMFAEVRKSEARYIPIHLKQVLQSTGHWGAVRLVPAATAVDVTVSGTIVTSNGKRLELEIIVVDATGKRWLEEKFKRDADISAYTSGGVNLQDPYQNLYHEVANDILAARRKLKDGHIARVRTVARLRFAEDLAPLAFTGYLEADKKGRYSIERLPAGDDPMLERVESIRERDYMFIDTLNEYYADLYTKMDGPYDDWRAFSYEEQVALDKLRRTARLEQILGAAAIIGGIFSSTKGRGGREAGEVAILGGMVAIQDSLDKLEQSKMHRQALQELGASLDSEVAPLLVDVEGEVMRLTGSVETQYASWRKLLRDVFLTETGMPVDPNSESIEVHRELIKP